MSSEDEVRALVEQSHLIDELQRQTGWSVLEDWVLRGPVGTVHKHKRLVEGKCKTIEEYASLTGFLQGVEFVLKAANDTNTLAVEARKRLDANAA